MAPSSSRVKMPIKRGTLGSCAVANTLDMVLQVCYTGVRVGEGWKVGVPCACVWAVGKAGDGTGQEGMWLLTDVWLRSCPFGGPALALA